MISGAVEASGCSRQISNWKVMLLRPSFATRQYAASSSS